MSHILELYSRCDYYYAIIPTSH